MTCTHDRRLRRQGELSEADRERCAQDSGQREAVDISRSSLLHPSFISYTCSYSDSFGGYVRAVGVALRKDQAKRPR